MRNVLLGTLTLLLAVAVPACSGDQTKDADAKADALPAAESAMKGGPSTKALTAQVFTGVTADAQSKDVSSISVGETQSGQLGKGDAQMDDGKYLDAWTMEIGSTAEVDIAVRSDAFDTYMVLMDGLPGDGGSAVDSNDDSDGTTNSRITTALKPGAYTIGITSYSAGSTGSYTVSVMDAGGTAEGAEGGEYLEPGTVMGRLSSSAPTLQDGTHYDLWQFQGESGEQVTITMTSGDFDTYLLLVRGTQVLSENTLTQDDDGAGGTNSRISYTLPESGTYSVVANSYQAGATGSYRLEFQTQMADWAEQYPGGGDPDGKYAVVVGIDDYPGTGLDLRGPVDDATLVRDVLVDKFGFSAHDIVFLQDDQATRMGIAHAILRHLGQAGPDGTAVFFYSGHGTHTDENIGITGRYDPEAGNARDEALAVYDGVILDEEVNFLLQQLEAENTLVLVDACYSGTVNRAADAMAKFVPADQADRLRKPTTFISADLTAEIGFGAGGEFESALANPDRHVFMAASSEDQVSWAIGSWPDRSGPASLWTYFWAQVVREVPPTTTFSEIQRMVSERVNRYVEDDQGLDTQTPQLLAPKDKASTSIGEFLGG